MGDLLACTYRNLTHKNDALEGMMDRIRETLENCTYTKTKPTLEGESTEYVRLEAFKQYDELLAYVDRLEQNYVIDTWKKLPGRPEWLKIERGFGGLR